MNTGYITILVNKKRIMQHRLIMEKHLQRKLKHKDIVHHINGDGLDNRIENLIIMNRSEHASHHYKNNPEWQKRLRENKAFRKKKFKTYDKPKPITEGLEWRKRVKCGSLFIYIVKRCPSCFKLRWSHKHDKKLRFCSDCRFKKYLHDKTGKFTKYSYFGVDKLL